MINSTLNLENPESNQYVQDIIANALYSSEQEILENDYVSTAHKKLVNSTFSADAKRAIVKERMLQKTLNMDGFEEQEVEMTDKDSGFIIQRDESGNIVSRTPIRLQAYGHYDGVDELENVKKSAYKQANQPKFVSMLTGKPEHELTEYDYANVKAYETAEAYNAMTYTGKGMYQSARYNPSIDYTANQTPKSAKVMVRLSGDDRYGRRLAEVVNPTNGRDIGFEFSNDPYTNASFDLYKSLDTKANRAGIEAKYKRYDVQSISKTIADKYDTDNRFLEDLDMVQASFYRMWARAAQHGPKAVMDTDYWAKVADESTGQEIADAWAGVKTSTRRAIASEMTKGLGQWKNGDYVDSIITIGSQFDRLFAESAAQTLTGVAVGAATLGAGLAAGAGTATASTIAMLSGATTAAVDNTLMSIEEYEANNGKAMSGADAAKTFAGYLVLAIPDTLFGALGIGKLLPKAITSSMNSVYKQGAKLSAGKHLVGGIVGEAAQEMGEESFGTYMSQDEKNAQSFTDILTSPETAVAGIAGGVMGGGLAAIPAAKGFTFDARKEAKQDKEREKVIEQRATKTVDNTDIDEVANDSAKVVVFNIGKQLASGTKITNSVDAVKQLDDIITSDGISEETVADATKVKTDLVRQQIDAITEINAKLAKLEEFRLTPAEALAEQASSRNAANVFVKTGKRLTDEAKQEVIKDLKDFGKSLGMDDAEIEKVLAEVIVEARDSWKGYNTYNKRIQKNLAILEDPTADENSKTKAKASLTKSVEQTASFYSNQVSKLDALTSGLLRLVDSENLGTISVEYPSTLGKKFTIKASNVINKKHDSGVAKTFNAVLTEAKNIHSILAALPEEYAHQILKTFPLEHIETLQKTFNNAIDRAVESENAMFHSEHKEGIDAANAVRLVKQLKSGKQLNDKVEASLKTRLASVSDKTLTQIQSLLDNDTSLSNEVKKDYINTIKQLRSEVVTSKANVEATTKSQGPAIGAARTTLNSYSNFKKHIKTAQHAGNAMRKLIEARKSLGTLVRTPEVVELATSITNLINEIDEHKKTLSEIHETDSIQNAKNDLAKHKDVSATSSAEDIAKAMKDLTNHIAILRKEKEEGNSTAAALLKAVTARYNTLSTLGKSTAKNATKNEEADKNRTIITNLRKYVASNRDKVQTKTINGIEVKYYVVPDSLMDGAFGMALDGQTVLISEFATKSPKDKRTAYLDAFNRAEKHGINMHKLAQNTDADTFTDLVLLHEYRHTQQRKLFDNIHEGVGRWELDAELYALLHTGLITQEQYDAIYNAELKPYVKERVQSKTSKQDKKDAVVQNTSVASTNNKPDVQNMSPQELLAYYNSLSTQTFDEDARGVGDDVNTANPKATATISDASNTTETVIEEKVENNKPSELVTETTTEIDSSEQQVVFTENHLNTNAVSENLYEEGALGDYKSNPMLNFGPASITDKTGDNVRTVKTVKNGKEVTENIYVYSKPQVQLRGPLKHDVRPMPKSRIISNVMQTGTNNKAYLQHVASKMKYLFLDFYSKLSSHSTTTYEKAEQKFTELLRQNPHLALLYGTISLETKDGVVKYKGGSIQANAAMAVDLACREFLSSMNVRATFNPTDAEDVCNAFGLESTSLKYKDIKALRTEVEKHGIPRRAKAIRLGRMIAQHMQIAERKYDPKEPNLKPHFGIWENIIAGLGDWGLRYMEANGWITYDSIDGKVVNTNAESDVLKAEKITTIKINNMNAIEQAVTSFLGPYENVTDTDGNIVYDASGVAKRRRNGKGLKSIYFTTKDSTEGPVTKPIKPLRSDEAMYIDGTQRMMLVPEYQREQVEQMQQVPHSINTELVELLTSYRDAVLDNLGYIPDSDLQALHQDSRSSAEGANLAITSQLRFLEEYMYRQLDEGVDWYFKGFVSKNGRIFYDSPTLNPQSGKTLTRFLVQPKQFYHKFKVGDEKHELYERFIISQAFDCLGKPEYSKNVQIAFNGLSAKVADEMLEDFVALKHSEFFKKYNPILSEIAGTDIKLDGVENYGQCLVVLQHIANKKAFIENGSKGTFNTWLSAEIDSTTSGYAIRALVYPTPEIIKEFGEKVGIAKAGTENADTPIHILKKKKGFLDIYKTLAARMVKNIGDALTSNNIEKFKAIYQDYNKIQKEQKKRTLKANVQNLSDVLSKLLTALPTPEYDADGNIVISSALRSLMKPAVMVFGYTGGKVSIVKNLSDTIMEDIFDSFYAIQHAGGKEAYVTKHNITDDKELKRIDAILDAMQYVASGLDTVEEYDGKTVKKKYDKTLQGLAAAIRDKSITNVRVKSGGNTLSLDEFFNEALGPIYGESTWGALEIAFLEHTVYNDAVNLTAASMYELFNNIWKPIQEALLRTEGLTESKYKEMLDALSEMWPSIPLIYTEVPALTEMETKNETFARERKSILIGGFDIDTSLTGNVTNYTPRIDKNGNPEFNQFGVPAFKSSGVSLTSDTKVLSNPKKFAAVGPIHYIDGMVLAMTLNKVFGIPVHDALVLSFDTVDESSKQYNNALFEVGKNYNLFGIFVDRFEHMMNMYKNFNKDNPEYSKIFEYYKLITGQDLEITPIDQLTVRDGFGKASEDFDFMQDLKDYLDDLRIRNDNDRAWFYGQNWSIANMEAVTEEGIGHSGETTIQNILEINKEHHADMIEQHASPRGFVFNNQMKELLSKTDTDPNARLEVIDKLQELAETLGNKVENAEYVQEIKGLLKAINPERIKNYSVSVIQDADFTMGKADHVKQEISLGLDSKKGTDLDSVTGLSVKSLQSPVEMYAHELVHAATRFGLVVLKNAKTNSYIHKLLQIQKVAMDIITWEDFMPDNYDPNLKQVYETQAKELWDYVFGTGTGENLSALSEFISYGLTNPKIRAKLAQHTMVEQKAKLSVLDRLVSFFRNLIGIITGDTKLGDIAESFMDLVKGNRTVFASKHTLLQELDKFTVAISHADKKAVNSFMKHPYKAFELVYNAYQFMMTRGNKHITNMYKYVFNYLDNHGKQYVKTSQSKAGTLSGTRTFLKLLARATFSSSSRKALHEVLQGMTKGIQQSVLASIFRDVTTPDEDSSRLEMFGLAARQVDSNSKAISSLVYKEISKAFGRVLNTGETEALTKVCLFTDLQCLTKDMTLAQIKSVLTNNTELHSQINNIEQRLKVLDVKDGMWLRNQAYGLARYMVTGIGNECQNLNARNIAAKLLLDNKAHEVNEEVVSLVDKLATLYAISFLDNNVKQVAANLPDTGLSVYLQHSKTFVDENMSGVTRTGEDSKTVNEIHVIKGYTKQILDDSYDTTVAPISNQQALNDAGYVLISKLDQNNVTGAGNLGLYRRSLTRPNRREGATFILNGAHAVGTTLKDSAFGVGAAETAEDVNALMTRYKNTIRKNSAHLANMMKHKKMELVDFQAFSEGYTPIISPTTGEAIDYRITMSTENKIKHLGMELDGLQILSKMFASHNTKLEAKLKNHVLIDYLYEHMHKHMKVGKRDEYGFTYTKISPSTDNKFLREAWKVIPDELRYRIEQEPLYVRTDWLQYLFGEPNMSAVQLLDALVKHKRPTWWKRAAAVVEMMLQTVAYGAKRATILFTPGVVVNNQISNANYSAMTHGVGILKVLKMQLQNAKATRDYLDTKKAYNQILHRERIGIATEAEIKKKQWYKTKLENNIVHPLMKKGMYQSIIEDLNTTELEATGKIGKFVKNSTWFNKIPKSIKSLVRVLYFGEGTFISTFMTQLTQYSDFVARATEYQLQMEKAPERYEIYTFNGKNYKRETKAYKDYEHKVMVDVLNTFINYDKPQSSIEQYANDMGIIQYTKFAKRIQGVVTKTISKNPMGAIMFLITQGMLVDTEDILEQNLVSKPISRLFYNPVDNFYNTIVPVPAQYLLDMRQAW